MCPSFAEGTMSNRWSSSFIRLAAPLLALGIAGAALAEPNSGGAVAQAACFGEAQTKYLLELQQCASQLGNPDAYYNCRDMAQLHYALAQSACSKKAAAVSGGSVILAAPSRTSGFGRLGPDAAAGDRPPFASASTTRGGLPRDSAGAALPGRR
jgi:hypothetical protein